MPFRSNVC